MVADIQAIGLSQLVEAATALTELVVDPKQLLQRKQKERELKRQQHQLPQQPHQTSVRAMKQPMKQRQGSTLGSSHQQQRQQQHQQQQQQRTVVSDDDEELLKKTRPQTQHKPKKQQKQQQKLQQKPQQQQQQQTKSTTSKKREIFPQRLMDILSDPTLTEIISWLPHGRSFVIIRPDIFTEEVLPKYLPPVDARASTKYPSFTRKLNRWGFRQATRGADTGAFYHPLFRRDRPELCLDMVCQKSRDRKDRPAPSVAAAHATANNVNNASNTNRASNSSVPRKALPPKKRLLQETAARGCDEDMDCSSASTETISNQSGSCSSSAPSSAAHPSPSGATAVSSQPTIGTDVVATTRAEAMPQPQHPPSATRVADTVVPNRTDEACLIPFISNDNVFVTQVLRERDTNETMRAAKAMLYDAYMAALRTPQHS